MLNQLHENDRRAIAQQLYLTLEEFNRLLENGNYAHDLLKKLGPFYGKEDIQEPTFRITAEPVKLPFGSKKLLTDVGNDLLQLGKALQKLPDTYKSLLGDGLDFRIPLTWRIDAIVNKDQHIWLNEVEGIDSVSALMMAEQLAYRLQSIEETTIYQFAQTLKRMFPTHSSILLAIIRTDLANNPFTPNARRFIEFIKELSQGTIDCDLYDIDELKSGAVKPEWNKYTAILNEAYCSPSELEELGVKWDQLLNAGNYNAMTNKGVFALFYEPTLQEFWQKELGTEVYERLQETLIPSSFIRTQEDLYEARKKGKTVKVNWAYGSSIIINRCKGVAIPYGDIEESSDDKWAIMEDYLKMGYKMIAQDFVEPAQISAYLRKRGTTLEHVEWYNRLCVKYVAQGNPNGDSLPSVVPTAAEVTLGPEVIPAGRKCAFTAGLLT